MLAKFIKAILTDDQVIFRADTISYPKNSIVKLTLKDLLVEKIANL